ncbi:hypothetical protein, partial [Pseudomonas sp. MPR-R5A]|uniref:hypothetical protein n=1 Tax=Pseudomonas sp. MPR-R5A TaxID=2070626 RepID=UPI001304B601
PRSRRGSSSPLSANVELAADAGFFRALCDYRGLIRHKRLGHSGKVGEVSVYGRVGIAGVRRRRIAELPLIRSGSA